ncbi:MAG: AtpZ/AtpI family protein [Egicoccus sp.]
MALRDHDAARARSDAPVPSRLAPGGNEGASATETGDPASNKTETKAEARIRREAVAGSNHVLDDSFRRSLRGVDHANVMSVELISAVLLWAGLGWLVDRWLGTPPWFLVIGGLIGNFAGLYLVYLRGERMNAEEARRREVAAGRTPATPTGSGA